MPDRLPPRRWGAAMATVRFRVAAIATAAVLVVLAVTGFVLVATQARLLTDGLDETLDARADELANRVREGELPPTLLGLGDEDSVVQVVRDGDVVAASPPALGEPPVAGLPSGGRTADRQTVDHLPPDGGDGRVRSLVVETSDGPALVLVAASLEDVHESTRVLSAALSVAVPVVAALLAALIWWLVGRTLRPVEAIRAEVAGIGGGDLDRRVPVPPGHDEVARLARTMNAMLDRVENAVRRQQRFTADASHELRSPLTRIRSEVEVDLAHPEGADLRATHRSVLDEVSGLQRLVGDLLHLARSDATAAPVARQPVDLDDVVLTEAQRVRNSGRVLVDATGVSAARVSGDSSQLGRVVGNVADNAARHARSAITITLSERNGDAVLTIADDGPGIPPEAAERVFDRFVRLDEARSGGGGTGLGLAIARDIVERHGGTIAVDAQHQPGARIVIRLPAGA